MFFDTCVLLKPYLCDTLLSIAECGLYRPLWSTGVLVELDRNLRKRGATEAQVQHRLDQMGTHFPDAKVTGYEDLVHSMTNDPKDRHVLAAAIRGGAQTLVTENLRDFPEAAVAPYDIVVGHQDEFLLDQLVFHQPSCSQHYGGRFPATAATLAQCRTYWPSLATKDIAVLASRLPVTNE